MTSWMWIELGVAVVALCVFIFFMVRRFRRYGGVVAVSPPISHDTLSNQEPRTNARSD
jgi:hypothetical protein